jgi:hypothetical protein
VPRGARKTLTDDRPHGTTHERKFESADHDRASEQGTGGRNQCIFLAGLFLGLDKTVAVSLAVSESQRVFRLQVGEQLLLGVRIEKCIEPSPRPNAHVEVALRTDLQVAFQFVTVQLRIAAGALDPYTFGHRARALFRADARGHQFFEPAHERIISKFRYCPNSNGAGMPSASG